MDESALTSLYKKEKLEAKKRMKEAIPSQLPRGTSREHMGRLLDLADKFWKTPTQLFDTTPLNYGDITIEDNTYTFVDPYVSDPYLNM